MLSSNDYLGLSHHRKSRKQVRRPWKNGEATLRGHAWPTIGRIFHQDLEEVGLISWEGGLPRLFRRLLGMRQCRNGIFRPKGFALGRQEFAFFPVERNQIERSPLQRFAPTTQITFAKSLSMRMIQ